MSHNKSENILTPKEKRGLLIRRGRMVLLRLMLVAVFSIPLLASEVRDNWWLVTAYIACSVMFWYLSPNSVNPALLCVREGNIVKFYFNFGSFLCPIEQIESYCRVLPGISLNPSDRDRSTMIYLKGGIYIKIKATGKIIFVSANDISADVSEYLNSKVDPISYQEIFPRHIWGSRLWQSALLVVTATWIYGYICLFGAGR